MIENEGNHGYQNEPSPKGTISKGKACLPTKKLRGYVSFGGGYIRGSKEQTAPSPPPTPPASLGRGFCFVILKPIMIPSLQGGEYLVTSIHE